MGCCEEKCSCPCHEKHKEQGDHSHGEHDEFVHFLFKIADEAWTEVLKEKIKEHILATQKDRMTELAKIASEGNSQRWKNKIEKKSGCREFKERLCQFFSHSKK
jgi:hypothetical protein